MKIWGPEGWGGGGGGGYIVGLIFAGYGPLASQYTYPIIGLYGGQI